MGLREENGVTVRGRGCMRGSSNYTCSEDFRNKEQCRTVDGVKVNCNVVIRFLLAADLPVPKNLIVKEITENASPQCYR